MWELKGTGWATVVGWVVWAGLPQEVLLGNKDETLGQQEIGVFVGGASEGQGEAGPEASTLILIH